MPQKPHFWADLSYFQMRAHRKSEDIAYRPRVLEHDGLVQETISEAPHPSRREG